jgi:hypothetical protein
VIACEALGGGRRDRDNVLFAKRECVHLRFVEWIDDEDTARVVHGRSEINVSFEGETESVYAAAQCRARRETPVRLQTDQVA